MIPKEKITIYDLAKQLNTTASTVSRALKDHPRISKKMKAAVHELADKLNYQPDPIAHHLRTGKGLVLGVIVPRIDRQFFASVIRGIQSVAQENEYGVIIAESNESYEKEIEAVKALVNKKVDGIAISISANTTDYSHLTRLMERGMPVVFFDRIPDMPGIDYVISNNYQVGYEAVCHLYEQGCRRIVHFAGPLNLLQYRERLAGYRQAILDLGLEYREEYVIENVITMIRGTEAATQLLTLQQIPDAIFSAGDYAAITAMDFLKKKGFAIPQDIAVVGVANEPFLEYLEPSLSSFELHNKQIGEETAKMLLQRMNQETDDSPRNLVLEPKLIVRSSSIKYLK